MSHEFKLPELEQEDVEEAEAEVSFWYVDEGESVEKGQDVVEMVTDKAAFTVPAPVSGALKSIIAAEGDKVKAGETLAIIE